MVIVVVAVIRTCASHCLTGCGECIDAPKPLEVHSCFCQDKDFCNKAAGLQSMSVVHLITAAIVTIALVNAGRLLTYQDANLK